MHICMQERLWGRSLNQCLSSGLNRLNLYSSAGVRATARGGGHLSITSLYVYVVKYCKLTQQRMSIHCLLQVDLSNTLIFKHTAPDVRLNWKRSICIHALSEMCPSCKPWHCSWAGATLDSNAIYTIHVAREAKIEAIHKEPLQCPLMATFFFQPVNDLSKGRSAAIKTITHTRHFCHYELAQMLIRGLMNNYLQAFPVNN